MPGTYLGTNLTGANLNHANLTQDQINRANGNEATHLPEGLTMPDHWKSDKPDDSADP